MNDAGALDLLAAFSLEDGRPWGEAAQPFQWDDARAVLDLDAAEPYHFLTRARGGSKTGDLAAMAVAVMLTQAPAGSRLYGVASDRDQAALLLDSISGYAARTPLLAGALEIGASKVTHPRSDVTLEMLPADAASVWGLRPFLTIVDEISQWGTTSGPRRVWEGVSSAAAKVKGGRLVALGTAGDPGHWSHKILLHALTDPLWRVREIPGPAPWMSKDRLAEQQRRLLPSSYARLFENRWTSPEDRLTTVDDLAACVTLDGTQPPQPGKRYVVGLDLGIVHDRTVAAICHAETVRREDGKPSGVRVALDRIQVWQGSRERPVELAMVADWLVLASREYNRAVVRYDPFQAILLSELLTRRSVPTERFNFGSQSVGRLATAVFRALREHALDLPDDEELLDELRNVRLRETSPGSYRLDHDPDKHDDRAIALALCVEKLVERGPQRPARTSVPRGTFRVPEGLGTATVGVAASLPRGGLREPFPTNGQRGSRPGAGSVASPASARSPSATGGDDVAVPTRGLTSAAVARATRNDPDAMKLLLAEEVARGHVERCDGGFRLSAYGEQTYGPILRGIWAPSDE